MIAKLLRRRTGRDLSPLVTRRLKLVTITAALLEAEAAGSGTLARALRTTVAPDWAPELWSEAVRAHIAAQLASHPATAGWCRYVVLRGRPEMLVGSVGAFPCAAGDVELGYSIVATQQRRGLATEAVSELTAWLLTLAEVRSVSAQAYVTRPESIKVMERCGLRPVGPGDEPATVRYRRWGAASESSRITLS